MPNTGKHSIHLAMPFPGGNVPYWIGFCLPPFPWRHWCCISNFFHMSPLPVSFPQINLEPLKALRSPKLHGLMGNRKVKWKVGGRSSCFSNAWSHRACFQSHAHKPHPSWRTEVIRKRNYRVKSAWGSGEEGTWLQNWNGTVDSFSKYRSNDPCVT